MPGRVCPQKHLQGDSSPREKGEQEEFLPGAGPAGGPLLSWQDGPLRCLWPLAILLAAEDLPQPPGTLPAEPPPRSGMGDRMKMVSLGRLWWER